MVPAGESVHVRLNLPNHFLYSLRRSIFTGRCYAGRLFFAAPGAVMR